MDYASLLILLPWANTILIMLGILGGGIKWALDYFRRARLDACREKGELVNEWKELHEAMAKDMEGVRSQIAEVKNSMGFCIEGMRGLHTRITKMTNLITMVHEDLTTLANNKRKPTAAELRKAAKRTEAQIVDINKNATTDSD